MSSSGELATPPAATPPAAPAAPAAAPSVAWHTGADSETLGYLQNRGWDKIEAKDAAFNAIKAHREAEKYIGAPADKLIRLPEASDAAGIKAMYQKLGAPENEQGYDFGQSVKFADGSQLDDGFVSAMSKVALANGLNKQQAASVAKAVVEFMESADAEGAAENQMTLSQQKDNLQKNWGNNFNANMQIARNAAAKLGVQQTEVDALEKSIGYDRVMEMFRNLGQRMGEDRFISSGAPGGTGVMTKEQAQAKLSSLMADREWTNRFTAGNAEATQQFNDLTRMVAGA